MALHLAYIQVETGLLGQVESSSSTNPFEMVLMLLIIIKSF